ncbi:hypothetical protein DY000_02038034 [Brassica cretica]|uniref:Uncharacterized protein n=1 Tax=Brassica cretica TaxID=69181 RepID=A0ABQ7BFC3_BRACR|nr:hypothetical protein DY000_02038034 [Brassica cretica]
MKLDSQRSVMQLIPTSLFTSVINKGKGIVVSDDKEERMGHSSIPNPQPKLMAAAISSGQTMFNTTTNVFCKLLLPSLQQSQVNQTSSLITFTAEPASSKEKDWKAQFRSRHNIKGAMLIAESVIRKDLFQSYIARGHPSWLTYLFV